MIRARRSFRPTLEPLSERIVPSEIYCVFYSSSPSMPTYTIIYNTDPTIPPQFVLGVACADSTTAPDLSSGGSSTNSNPMEAPAPDSVA